MCFSRWLKALAAFEWTKLIAGRIAKHLVESGWPQATIECNHGRIAANNSNTENRDGGSSCAVQQAPIHQYPKESWLLHIHKGLNIIAPLEMRVNLYISKEYTFSLTIKQPSQSLKQ